MGKYSRIPEVFYAKYFENECIRKAEKYYQQISSSITFSNDIMEYVQMVNILPAGSPSRREVSLLSPVFV